MEPTRNGRAILQRRKNGRDRQQLGESGIRRENNLGRVGREGGKGEGE